LDDAGCNRFPVGHGKEKIEKEYEKLIANVTKYRIMPTAFCVELTLYEV